MTICFFFVSEQLEYLLIFPPKISVHFSSPQAQIGLLHPKGHIIAFCYSPELSEGLIVSYAFNPEQPTSLSGYTNFEASDETTLLHVRSIFIMEADVVGFGYVMEAEGEDNGGGEGTVIVTLKGKVIGKYISWMLVSCFTPIIAHVRESISCQRRVMCLWRRFLRLTSHIYMGSTNALSTLDMRGSGLHRLMNSRRVVAS